MDVKDQATSLAVARIVIGGAAWVAPRTSLRASLLDTSAQSSLLLRLFAARDVALGALTLMAAPTARPAFLKMGMAVDGADAAAALLALRSGAVPTATGTTFAGMAVTAVVAGAIGLGQRR